MLWLLRPVFPTLHRINDRTKLDLHRIKRGFHGAFATGVASQQGALTLLDTWFRPPFWDLLMLQLLRPNSSNLPCLCSTFHLEYPLVLSRFYFVMQYVIITFRRVIFSDASTSGFKSELIIRSWLHAFVAILILFQKSCVAESLDKMLNSTLLQIQAKTRM